MNSESFTFEETTLMGIYNTGTRTGLIDSLTEIRGYLADDEPELKALTDSTIEKLRRLTDAEYEKLDLMPEF